MTAQIIALSRRANGNTPIPPRTPLPPSFRASLGGAARRYWRRVRLSVEAAGWIVIAASIMAAIIR